MTPEELQRAIEKAIAEAERKIGRSLEANTQAALSDLLALTAKLKSKGGRISPTIENLKIKATIRASLRRVLIGTGFAEAVNAAIAALESLGATMNEYFATGWSAYSQGPQLSAMIQDAITGMRQAMGGTAIGEQVAAQVDSIFRDAITTGAAPRDLITQLRALIEGGALEKVGRVTLKQVATDAMGQFSRSYMVAAANRLKLDWFRYAGIVIDTTRPFCEARAGKYFHRSEIEGWASMNWDGKVAGTNRSTIFVYLGGWNCLHTLIPVPASAVPADVRARVGSSNQS